MASNSSHFTSRALLAVCLLVVALVFFTALSLAASEPTQANYGVDGGDLLAAVLTNGVPHPTGYPTYMLLGNLFQRIPLGTPYFRGTLLSALPSALAAGLLAAWLGLSHRPPSLGGGDRDTLPIPAILAGLAWGAARLADAALRMPRPGAPMALLKTAVQFLANANPYTSLRAERDLGWRPITQPAEAAERTGRALRRGGG